MILHKQVTGSTQRLFQPAIDGNIPYLIGLMKLHYRDIG